MGGRLEGTNYQRQVVPKRVLLERGECDQRFVAPVMVHKLFQVVCCKVTKDVVTRVNASIASGKYASTSDLVRAAIDLLLSQEIVQE